MRKHKSIVTQKHYEKLSNLVCFVVYLHNFFVKKFHKLYYINIERKIIILQLHGLGRGIQGIFHQDNLTNDAIWGVLKYYIKNGVIWHIWRTYAKFSLK